MISLIEDYVWSDAYANPRNIYKNPMQLACSYYIKRK